MTLSLCKSVNIIMPMAQKTSINIKPCNIGSSEAHNRRTAEYLAHIGKESSMSALTSWRQTRHG